MLCFLHFSSAASLRKNSNSSARRRFALDDRLPATACVEPGAGGTTGGTADLWRAELGDCQRGRKIARGAFALRLVSTEARRIGDDERAERPTRDGLAVGSLCEGFCETRATTIHGLRMMRWVPTVRLRDRRAATLHVLRLPVPLKRAEESSSPPILRALSTAAVPCHPGRRRHAAVLANPRRRRASLRYGRSTSGLHWPPYTDVLGAGLGTANSPAVSPLSENVLSTASSGKGGGVLGPARAGVARASLVQ